MKLRLIILAVSVLFGLTATLGQTQIKLTPLDPNRLPNDLKWEGKIKNAVRWTDKLGEHWVITTETGIFQNKKWKHEAEGMDAELFAYHFLMTNGKPQITWKVYDFIRDCPLDLEATFIKNTFQVTDLNKDGVAEIWLMYKTVCHGDVSPYDMKIIMYQGGQKYAVRGRNKVKISERGYEGGEYKPDTAFTTGPKEFLDYAQQLWQKNSLQTWNE
ncbi:MAG: hypothetical protein U0X91_19265 [Spirosomataceae bacterium]